ncbi:hypothetical protein DFH11DRAFT_1885877 [Phellopilus nigrolimitatus]|nr:hypothetical protein DFH11DRAFT_1885877 [Phellopilus nigrolimitatus]
MLTTPPRPSPRASSYRNLLKASSALSQNRGTRPPTADRLHVYISVLTALSMNHEVAALVDSEEERAITKTSLSSWMNCAATSSVHGATLRPKARSRAKLVEENDRNWLEFLVVLDATFAAPAVADKLAGAEGRRDCGALLALLEPEKRLRENEFGPDLKSQYGMASLIKLEFETFSDKACRFKDLKSYTILEDAELSALDAYLNAHPHVSDNEPALCLSISAHRLWRPVLCAEGLSAAQETMRALAYLSA